MSFYRIALLTFSFFVLSGILRAQSLSPELITSEGGFLTSPSGSISYSIGEPVIETVSGTTNILTQGFQQPEIISLTGIEQNEASTELYVFPNPVKDQLSINFSGLQFGAYSVRVIDVAGKELEQKSVEVGNDLQVTLSLNEYNNGCYFIEIGAINTTYHKTIKVIKN